MKVLLPFSIIFLVNFTLHAQHIITDSTLKPHHKIDSIKASFYTQSDSLKQKYQHKFLHLDSNKYSLQHKVDSLTSLQLSTEKYKHKLDSINVQQSQLLAELYGKIDTLKSHTTGSLRALNVPPEWNEKLTTATNNIDGFAIPNANLPGNSYSLSVPASDIKAPLSEMESIKELGSAQENIGDITKCTTELGSYQKDLQQVSQGDLKEVRQVPKGLESKATDATGIGNVHEQATAGVEPLKDIADQVQNPDAAKEQMIEKSQEIAIDHFAGKEEVLQQTMNTISKYKKKYTSVNNLEEVTKKRTNQMHSKPLVERIVPGVTFQIQKKESDVLIDINPSLGYRFTGHITAGGGWNHRIIFDKIKHSNTTIYGPRFFGEYKLVKGISPRLAVECMHTNIPPGSLTKKNDPTSTTWVWSYMAGIKKEYRFYKNIKGTVSVMFNLYNRHHRSPYVDVVITHFGFELPMKKSQK